MIVVYPPIINTDFLKYAACERLKREIIDYNCSLREVALSKNIIDKYRTYARISKKLIRPLVNEITVLRESIRLSQFPTDKSWKDATDNKTDEYLESLYESLYGIKTELQSTNTKAKTPILDELKSIVLDDLITTIKRPGTEDFTTYTETDPDGEITVTADKITWAAFAEGTDGYVYKEGKSFDGNFEHLVQIYCDSTSDDYADINHWAMMNDVGSWEDIDTANGSGLGCRSTTRGAGTTRIYLLELDSGAYYYDGWTAADADQLYHLEIERVESVGTYGTAYIYICTGDYWDDGGTQKDTLSIALHTSKKDYDTIYGFQNIRDSAGGSCYGYTQLLDLQEAAPAAANPGASAQILNPWGINEYGAWIG